MARFCQECGSELHYSAKFCPECGKNLSQIPSEKGIQYSKGLLTSFLGEKMEEAVEKIFQAKGYSTSRRNRLKGKNGITNEIDVIAEKGRKRIAVECKNLKAGIGPDHLRNFYKKLEDLSIRKGYFASNSDFTSGAKILAQQNNITLWNRDNLMELIYSISVGRGYEHGQRLQLRKALPIKEVDYHSAISLAFKNEEKLENESELIYRPYFTIQYIFKARYKDPTRKEHRFKDEGTVYIDAIDGRV